VFEFFDAVRHAWPIGHAHGLSDTHTAYPVAFQAKKFGHVLWIHTPIGREFFDAAWHTQRGARLIWISFDKPPEKCLGSVENRKDMGGRRRIGERRLRCCFIYIPVFYC